jgi:hypothetical protein
MELPHTATTGVVAKILWGTDRYCGYESDKPEKYSLVVYSVRTNPFMSLGVGDTTYVRRTVSSKPTLRSTFTITAV